MLLPPRVPQEERVPARPPALQSSASASPPRHVPSVERHGAGGFGDQAPGPGHSPLSRAPHSVRVETWGQTQQCLPFLLHSCGAAGRWGEDAKAWNQSGQGPWRWPRRLKTSAVESAAKHTWGPRRLSKPWTLAGGMSTDRPPPGGGPELGWFVWEAWAHAGPGSEW